MMHHHVRFTPKQSVTLHWDCSCTGVKITTASRGRAQNGLGVPVQPLLVFRQQRRVPHRLVPLGQSSLCLGTS